MEGSRLRNGMTGVAIFPTEARSFRLVQKADYQEPLSPQERKKRSACSRARGAGSVGVGVGIDGGEEEKERARIQREEETVMHAFHSPTIIFHRTCPPLTWTGQPILHVHELHCTFFNCDGSLKKLPSAEE